MWGRGPIGGFGSDDTVPRYTPIRGALVLTSPLEISCTHHTTGVMRPEQRYGTFVLFPKDDEDPRTVTVRLDETLRVQLLHLLMTPAELTTYEAGQRPWYTVRYAPDRAMTDDELERLGEDRRDEVDGDEADRRAGDAGLC